MKFDNSGKLADISSPQEGASNLARSLSHGRRHVPFFGTFRLKWAADDAIEQPAVKICPVLRDSPVASASTLW